MKDSFISRHLRVLRHSWRLRLRVSWRRNRFVRPMTGTSDFTNFTWARAANALIYTPNTIARVERDQSDTIYESDEKLEVLVWPACGEFMMYFLLLQTSSVYSWFIMKRSKTYLIVKVIFLKNIQRTRRVSCWI